MGYCMYTHPWMKYSDHIPDLFTPGIYIYIYIYFLWEREGMRHAPSRLGADVEDSIRARQVGIRPLDGSALCPTP